MESDGVGTRCGQRVPGSEANRLGHAVSSTARSRLSEARSIHERQCAECFLLSVDHRRIRKLNDPNCFRCHLYHTEVARFPLEEENCGNGLGTAGGLSLALPAADYLGYPALSPKGLGSIRPLHQYLPCENVHRTVVVRRRAGGPPTTDHRSSDRGLAVPRRGSDTPGRGGCAGRR